MKRLALTALFAAPLAACGGPQPTHVQSASATPPPEAPAPPGWLAEASPEDRDRLDHLADLWRESLAAVPVKQAALVKREGDLLKADAARTLPSPTPGSYRCRLVRLSAGEGLRSFNDFVCYIRAESGNRLTFTKQTGTELPGGWLHQDGDRRLVLMGAKQRAVGDNSLAYGTDPARDLVGVVERIGPFRWRLTLPLREGKPGLDIYELTPMPIERQVDEPLVPELMARK